MEKTKTLKKGFSWTKALFSVLAVSLVIVAFSGCDYFSSKEGQTSVINYPSGKVGSYTVRTSFPEHSINQLVTIKHLTHGDQIELSYTVGDYNTDGVIDIDDCRSLELRINGKSRTTLYSGRDAAANGEELFWIQYDGTGCKNTTHTLFENGSPLTLAIIDNSIDINTISGRPGIINFGNNSNGETSWNMVGTSAELELVSNFGVCSDGQEWNYDWGFCAVPEEEPAYDVSGILTQPINCYHKVYGEGIYAGQYIKCGQDGCIYPNNSLCNTSGCYNYNGTPFDGESPMWENDANFAECLDEYGNPTYGGGGGSGEECPEDVKKLLGYDDGCHECGGVWMNGAHSQYIWNDGWSTEVHYCEKEWQESCDMSIINPGQPYCAIVREENKTCEVCFDTNNVQISKSCSDDDPTECSGEGYCEKQQNGDETCEICYDSCQNETWRDCWREDGHSDIADKHDAERQKRDMQNNLKDYEKSTVRDIQRIVKEVGRTQKDIDNHIKRFNKLLSRAGSSGYAADTLTDGLDWKEKRKSELAETLTDANALLKVCEGNIPIVKAKIEAITPGTSTWDDLDRAWKSIRRYLEPCWAERTGVEFPLRVAEQENELGDITFELSKAMLEMDDYGVKIPGFVKDLLEEMEDLKTTWMSKAMACKNTTKTLAVTVRNTTEPKDIDWAMEDLRDAEQDCNWDREDMHFAFDSWRQNEPWQVQEKAWRTLDDKRYIEEDKRELEKISVDLKALAELGAQVRTDDSFVQENLDNLERLRQKALPMVEEMLKATETGDYVEFEQLEALGYVFEQSAEVIAKFCSKMPQNCSLSPEVHKLIFERHNDPGEPRPEEPNKYYDDFRGYEEDLVDRIVDKIFKKVESEIAIRLPQIFNRIFNETMADKIATHMEGAASQIFTNLFNNAETLGDDRIKKVAENSTEVYDVLAKFGDYELTPEVAGVVNDWQTTVVASGLKNEVDNDFQKLLENVRAGEDTAPLVAGLKQKLSDNDVRLATEDKAQFLDAKLADNDWYYGYFMGSSFEGDSDDYGKPTGYVRPSGLINRCEALKVAIEAAGIQKVPGASDWWCSTYVETALAEGFNMTSNPGDRGYYSGNPTRAEIAQLWVDAGNLETIRYNSEFPDVGYNDHFAETVATVNKYGIITGQGDGRFAPYNLTNRAEVAAMEVRFRKAIQASQLFKAIE